MINAAAIGRLFTRRRLPVLLGRDGAMRFLPWIFALMAYVAGLGGIALLALGDAPSSAEASAGAQMTLVVPAGTSNARMETVLALLHQAAGVAEVRQLTPAEIGELLKPWLGPAPPLNELPIPRVVDVRLKRGSPIDLATLRQHLASVAPGAKLDDQRAWLAALRHVARRIARVDAVIVAAALLLVVPAALFAARTRLMIRQPAIELVHLLGAANGDIARPFALRALADGLAGGGIGGAAVIATVAALGDAGALAPTPLPGLADWRIWAIIAGVALAVGAIATASALAVTLRRLAELP